MALASFQLDPNVVALTNDDHITAINAATAQITRASSVAAAARPLISGEVDTVNFALGAVDTAALGANAVTNPKLGATAARDNLDATPGLDRNYIQTNPISGEFPVIAIQRDAAGNLDVDYDNVAIV